MLETIHLEHTPPAIELRIALYRDVQNSSQIRSELLAGNQRFNYAFINASLIISTTHLLAACDRAIHAYLTGSLRSRNVHSEIVLSLSPNNNIGEAFRTFGVPAQPDQSEGSEKTVADGSLNGAQGISLLVVYVSEGTDDSLTQENAGDSDGQHGTTISHTIQEFASLIDGRLVPFSDTELAASVDLAQVSKAYKLRLRKYASVLDKSNKRDHRSAGVNQITPRESLSRSSSSESTSENRAFVYDVEMDIIGSMALRGIT